MKAIEPCNTIPNAGDAEITTMVAVKLDNGSPKPIKTAIYEPIAGKGAGLQYIKEALEKADGVKPEFIADLRVNTLRKYDVLILSAINELSATDKADQAKGVNWEDSLLNFIDSGKGVILGHDCVGFRHVFAGNRIFPKVCVGSGRAEWWKELRTTDKTHPVMAGAPNIFEHSYYDHITITPGPNATVLAEDCDGNPVIIAGNLSRGRVVALGYPMGSCTKNIALQPKSSNAPLSDAEKVILCNSVRWCSEPARYDVPELLTKSVLFPELVRYNEEVSKATDLALRHFTPSGSYVAKAPPPSGNPYGGGMGYKRIISEGKADYIAGTKDELLNALSRAASGEIIYVKDTAEIDLTNWKEITIPVGVTLASGRGAVLSSGKISEGGLIRTQSHGVLFVMGGRNVRITGLRISGPAPDLWPKFTTSVGVKSFFPVEIDNCDIWGWVRAISVEGTDNPVSLIHNNLIHHCRDLSNMGYGVAVGNSGGTARIEENIFDYCRHPIAAGGKASYEASYNIIGKNVTSTSFDMHGNNDEETYFMLANWRFDENDGDVAYDFSEGSAHPSRMTNLKITGAKRVKNGKYGELFGLGLKFNGWSDYAECPADNFKLVCGSIEFWIKPDIRNGDRDVFYLHENADNFFLIRKNADDKMEVIIKDHGVVKLDAVSSKVLDSNYHYVVVRRSDLKMFIDGVNSELNGMGLTSSIWTNHMDKPKLWLGRGPKSCFSGVLDEVRIYSQALSESLVDQHFKYPDMAGGWIKIHHNVFYSDCRYFRCIIGIRGIPMEKSEIFANVFAGISQPEQTVSQFAPSKGRTRFWNRWENGCYDGIGIDVHDNEFGKASKAASQ